MKFAAKKITDSRDTVIEVNLKLSEDKGLAFEKRRLSKLSRSAWKTIGKTNMRWKA